MRGACQLCSLLRYVASPPGKHVCGLPSTGQRFLYQYYYQIGQCICILQSRKDNVYFPLRLINNETPIKTRSWHKRGCTFSIEIKNTFKA